MFGLVFSATVGTVDVVTPKFQANKHPPLATQYARSPAPLSPPRAKNLALHYTSAGYCSE